MHNLIDIFIKGRGVEILFQRRDAEIWNLLLNGGVNVYACHSSFINRKRRTKCSAPLEIVQRMSFSVLARAQKCVFVLFFQNAKVKQGA